MPLAMCNAPAALGPIGTLCETETEKRVGLNASLDLLHITRPLHHPMCTSPDLCISRPLHQLISHRPGDVLLARVISLGDSRAYFLTTAAVELGVVFARSAEGVTMLPVSWQEMMCPATKNREPRKVKAADYFVISAPSVSTHSSVPHMSSPALPTQAQPSPAHLAGAQATSEPS